MKNILITGTGGYVGKQLVERIKSDDYPHKSDIGNVVALDVVVPKEKVEGVYYYVADIRNKEKLQETFKKHGINTVIHMAAVLAPSPRIPVEDMYKINVDGTRNILECCYDNKVERFVAASSGAAYGYFEDNSDWLSEDNDPIRGNMEFPYSFHKRVNEEDFKLYQKIMPEMKQFIFRIGTVLGKNVDNLITDLFKKPVITGIKGSDTPFVFIWDEDLVEIVLSSLFSDKPGAYNVAGDGAVKLPEIAKYLNKKFLPLPTKLVENALGFMRTIGVSQYGPEQVRFLKYRPVLDNKKLKEVYGYIPRKTSHEVFEFFLENGKLN
jgi:UDP-glucose 4-epimerase